VVVDIGFRLPFGKEDPGHVLGIRDVGLERVPVVVMAGIL